MRDQHGFSLVESLLVIVMIGIIIVLMANLPNAFNLINKSNHLSLAKEIASKQIEDKRTVQYVNLVNNSSLVVDSRLSLLPQGSGSILVEDCSILICTNGEHVKQITVTINWKDMSKAQTVTLKAMISEGGLNQ